MANSTKWLNWFARLLNRLLPNNSPERTGESATRAREDCIVSTEIGARESDARPLSSQPIGGLTQLNESDMVDGFEGRLRSRRMLSQSLGGMKSIFRVVLGEPSTVLAIHLTAIS